MTAAPPPKPAAIIRAHLQQQDRRDGIPHARIQILHCDGRRCVVRTCARWVVSVTIDGRTQQLRGRQWWYETDTVTPTGKVRAGRYNRVAGSC